MEPEVKHVRVQAGFKADAEEGTLECVFSTFNLIDRHGDIVEAGAIPAGPVAMVWSHDWAKVIGKGAVTVDDDKATFTGRFFLDIPDGLNAYNTVKAMEELQEYSFGYRVLEADYGEREGKYVRIIKSLELFEVSPVVRGAGIGTHTVGIKSGSLPFLDHSEAVLAAVTDLGSRARSLADLRQKEGRTLSTVNRERLESIADAMSGAAGDIKQMLKDTAPPAKSLLDHTELLNTFLYIEARANGVTTS